MTDLSKKSLVEIPLDLALEVFEEAYKLGYSVDQVAEFSLKLWLALVQEQARCILDGPPEGPNRTKGVVFWN